MKNHLLACLQQKINECDSLHAKYKVEFQQPEHDQVRTISSNVNLKADYENLNGTLTNESQEDDFIYETLQDLKDSVKNTNSNILNTFITQSTANMSSCNYNAQFTEIGEMYPLCFESLVPISKCDKHCCQSYALSPCTIDNIEGYVDSSFTVCMKSDDKYTFVFSITVSNEDTNQNLTSTFKCKLKLDL